MDKLKKSLIRNGLPTEEIIDLMTKYMTEIKTIVEKLVERFRKKERTLNSVGPKLISSENAAFQIDKASNFVL